VEITDGFGSGGFDRVGDREHSRRFAIDSDIHRGLAFFLKLSAEASSASKPAMTFSFAQEIGFADHHRTTRDGADNPARRHRTKGLDGLETTPRSFAPCTIAAAKRVLAVLLQRGGKAQELLRVETGCRAGHPSAWVCPR
jgi:hypothetical protein